MPYKTIITVGVDGKGTPVPDIYVYKRFFISPKAGEMKNYVGKNVTIAVKRLLQYTLPQNRITRP